MRAMQVERLDGDVIQTTCLQSGLLPHFAEGRVLWLLAFLDVPVHSFPRRGTAGVERALQHQHAPTVAKRPDDVNVDGAYRELGHGWLTKTRRRRMPQREIMQRRRCVYGLARDCRRLYHVGRGNS